MGRLDGKVVFITGAGSGMGRAASVRFAREGARVVVAEVAEAAGRQTVDEVHAAGGEALFVRTDVSREADVAAAIRAGEAAFGRIDVLYNNAGIFPPEDGSVVDLEEAVWDRVMAVNLKGIYLVCKHGIPALLRAGGGSVINIASFVALVGCTVPQDAYTASKGGVIALTKSLAVQFGPRGIRTNAICPGPIETPLLTQWLLTNPEAKAVRLARIPMGRFGRPDDIVAMALYLASDESSWTNGAVLVVDGGITSNYF
ncbi:MAG: glucose 1-dehydrogenase [Firmicutes bacterium]|jgi:NAD(P)-dependent dehydrogenase (short-subunit alcohol dehydrogenase family)|nr:glucose 1-dehydrogenase [Bacillota bacterium]